MDKKIAQQLAALYARHRSLMNLIRALEEYSRRPEAPLEVPARVARSRRRHSPRTPRQAD